MSPRFEVAQILPERINNLEENKVRKPFLLLETTPTSDGPHTRICDGRWPTLREARAELKRREG